MLGIIVFHEGFSRKFGEFADIDHLIPAQTDHRFRGKLTT
jgi:hypothetical protein